MSLTAYRAWKMDVLPTEGAWLTSLNWGGEWRGAIVRSDRRPRRGNEAGYYAFKHPRAAAQYVDGKDTVLGTVRLWGRVVEHEGGYRAERCQVMALWDAVYDGVRWRKVHAGLLGLLQERYACDIVPPPRAAKRAMRGAQRAASPGTVTQIAPAIDWASLSESTYFLWGGLGSLNSSWESMFIVHADPAVRPAAADEVRRYGGRPAS